MRKLESSQTDALGQNKDEMKKAAEFSGSAQALLQHSIDQQQAETRKRNAIIYGVE